MPVEAKPLFRPDALRPYLRSFGLPDAVQEQRGIVQKWADLLTSPEGDSFSEQELLADFVSDIFCGVLGYTRPADNPAYYTRAREKYIQVDGKYADAVLGEFAIGKQDKPFVAVEGKGPKDPLDRPFAGRKKSAVEQGYGYAINLPCDWIVVTSMRQTRLYHKGSDYQTYERFDIQELAANDSVFRKFVYLLAAERVVPAAGRCHLYDLHAASRKVGRQLTKEIYVKYADIRQDVFETLCAKNPGESRHAILEATQKLLDRVLFTAFCEDRGLLPDDTLKTAFEHQNPYSPQPIWSNFRGLFKSIDVGNEELKIPPYNGGLFADDPFLEKLTVPDGVCAYFRDLGEYEYRVPSEVAADAEADDQARLIDVEILGHIFEQSITDLEQIRNELDGLVEPVGKEKHKTRRKKEGAFYTPDFITRYIIEQTLGGVLADRFENLRQSHAAQAKGTAGKSLADPSVYDLAGLNKPQRDALIRFWESWQDELATIRILDPACGSGAFLIEAFDQLHAAYQASNDRLQELRGHRTLFDLDRRILQNNLFGVDLNEEAIQICRLSLWIKTAQAGKTLTSLDDTICTGNSVVDDPAVHDKAFNWHEQFSEVLKDGGFDVVVSNPPYIRQEWIAAYKPHWKRRFGSYTSTADIYVYFYELAFDLLKQEGKLGFITSGSWMFSRFGSGLRKFISENSRIESLVDFGEFQPFEGAEMIRPSITVLAKARKHGKMQLFKWLTKGEPPANLSDVIAASPQMTTAHLSEAAWELEPDDVRALKSKMLSVGKSLKTYCKGKIIRGVVTGRNEAFLVNDRTRCQLIEQHPSSAAVLHRYVMGTDVHGWHVLKRDRYIIFTKQGIEIDKYPAIHDYLSQFREVLEPKKTKDDKGPGRKPGSYNWYEIQDTCDFYSHFEKPKIVWPDIAKLPRFVLDADGGYLDATCFMIPGADYYLLGILSTWATWFLISKMCQPLRLRGDRWQYRLKKQWLVNLRVPDASDDDRRAIGELARQCNSVGRNLCDTQGSVRERLTSIFGEQPDGTVKGKLNNKASDWWLLTLNQLGAALKSSFKLAKNPFQNPKVADDWEPYLNEKVGQIEQLTRQLVGAEAELNERVFRLFDLTSAEIRLLQKEVEH